VLLVRLLVSTTPASTGAAAPRWWPARWYYGWALVGTLGVTETVSYGVLLYAFAVFVTPMGAELGWSKAQVTGAYSLATLVLGLAAIPVGRWVDRHGTRALMALGSTLAAALLVAWSLVRSLAAFYMIWALLGVAMAAVLYEPAFALIATWFRARRGRALTVLTFLGGFASVVFVPLTTWLVAHEGWRGALVRLAAILAALTILPHAVLLRRRPQDLGLSPDGGVDDGAHTPSVAVVEESVDAETAVRSASFRWLTLAFSVAAFASTAVSVHLVSLLLERGYGAGFAGAAMGTLGLMALPGRLVFTPLGSRWPRSVVTAAIFVLSGLGCFVLLAVHDTLAVWAFVALFGAGFGAISPARAALLAEHYGHAHYGRIAGVQALVVAFTKSVAPVGMSLVYAAAGPRHGYDAVLGVLLILCGVAAAGTLAAAGTRRPSVHLTPVTSS
jgi:MFS family permease